MEEVPKLINEENGLVLYPTQITCLEGDACVKALRNPALGCRPNNDHHLYFYKSIYTSGGPESLPYKLRNSKFAIQSMAKCRHDAYHRVHDPNPPKMPNEKVATEFVRQSSILEGLGSLAIKLARLRVERGGLYQQDRPWEERILKLNDVIPTIHEQVEEQAIQARRIDLIPAVIVENPFDYMYRGEQEYIRESASFIVRTSLNLALLDKIPA